jgi:CubicO group peptidase (beta-lactamase class C family)
MAITLVNRRLALSGLFSAIALISQTSPPSGTAEERVASPSVQDIQQSLRFVPDRMAHYHVPGLSLSCIHNGAVEWTQAFGVARVGGEPVTPETLFQASSIGMPLTAVAVLRLVEQGKLNLDADVSQYFRSWKLPTNRFAEQKKVTLRDCSATRQAQPSTALRITLLENRYLRLSRCLMAKAQQTLHR